MNYHVERKRVPAKYPERLVSRSFQAWRLLKPACGTGQHTRPLRKQGSPRWRVGLVCRPIEPCAIPWDVKPTIRHRQVEGRRGISLDCPHYLVDAPGGPHV